MPRIKRTLPPDCLDREATGLQAVLPYWHIQDGVVHLADGTVELGFELHFPPLSGLGPEGVQALYDGMRTLLNDLGREGTRIRFIFEVIPAANQSLVRNYAKGVKDDEEVLRAYGERRKRWLEELSRVRAFYDYRYYLTIQTKAPRAAYVAPNPAIGVLSELLPFLKKRDHVPFLPDEYLEWRQEIELMQARIETSANVAGIQARALDDAELFALIFRTLNPDKPVPDYLPPVRFGDPEQAEVEPESLATNLNDRLVRSVIDNRDLSVLRIGSVFHRLYQIVDMPVELTFGALQNALLWIDPPYRAVLDFVPLSPEKTRSLLTRKLGDARAMQTMAAQNDLEPTVESEETAAQVREMMRYLVQTGELVFKVSGAVILQDQDERALYRKHNEFLAASAREITTPVLPIERGVLKPFLHALPLNGQTIPGQKLYVAADAIKYAAYQAPWRTENEEPREVYITRWNVPIGINIFRQPGLYNANALVVGTAGSGKSFFVQQRLLEYLKGGDAIAIAIDKDRFSYDGLYKLFAERGLGTKLELSADSGITINPFDLPEGATEPDELKLYFLEALLTTMVPPSEDPNVAATELAVIEAAIDQAYKSAVDEDEVDGEVRKVFTGLTMSEFVQHLDNLNTLQGRSLNAQEKEVAKALATRFQRWTRGHPRGKLFDGPSTFRIDENTRFVYFVLNMQETEKELFPVSLLAVSDLTWRLSLQSRFRHKLVVFEEAWSMMENPATFQFINEFFRAARKRNVASIAISQALDDFLGDRAAAFVNNVSHIVYFRTTDSLETKQRVMPKVPETLYSMVGGGAGYRNALLWLKGEQEVGDIITVQADPISYWIFTSKPDDLEKRRALEAELGSFSLAVLTLAGEITLDEARERAQILSAVNRSKSALT